MSEGYKNLGLNEYLRSPEVQTIPVETATELEAKVENLNKLSIFSSNLGAITSGSITLDKVAFIRAGINSWSQYAYDDPNLTYDDPNTNYDGNSVLGFFLGYDTLAIPAYKFFIGNTTGNYFSWDGSVATLIGALKTSAGSSLDGTYLLALSVTSAKIADLAVTNAKIANLAVNTAKIALASITTALIGDLQVTNAKVASGLSAAKVTTGILQSSDGKTYFDLDTNKRIIINDTVNDRILLGYLAGGF